MTELTEKHCVPCEGGTEALDTKTAERFLAKVEGWTLDNDGKVIYREYRFKNYYQTIAFVNALAWIAHQEDHHPDLEVGYNRCLVRYSTHAIGGLSENDFICAAKVNALLDQA
ncbi:MAG TPA: 4a-hydroxytetrahydrobiopterin dehydratase [Gammaproteobacteria bacterium]|nr:4a-hydroxytetrahydrobiopterin dehydratase [Gammaproteobacteria bacterium]